MARECVFCGVSGPLTREHVWPAWIAGLKLVSGSVEVGRGRLNQLPTFSGAQKPFDVTVKDVCAQCNNEWMSHLEDAVKPVLAPMILGHPTTVRETSQAPLALWALKTALVSMLVSSKADRRRGYGVPVDEYHALHSSRLRGLPPDTSVWLGSYGGDRHLVASQITPIVTGNPRAPDKLVAPDGYVFSLLLGTVFLIGVRFTDPRCAIPLRSTAAFAQVWPVLGDAHWPCGDAVEDAAFVAAQRGSALVPRDPALLFGPWRPAVDLPPSTLAGSDVRLPCLCGKHVAYYPALLVREAFNRHFYAFTTRCECGVAYLVHTEQDGAHTKMSGSPQVIAAHYEEIPGNEVTVSTRSGPFQCKRIPPV